MAKCAGVSVDTERCSERNGLLSSKSLPASGYRRYNAGAQCGLPTLIAAYPGPGRSAAYSILRTLGAEGPP